MRTTVDFPDELHVSISALARDKHQSFSKTVVEIVRDSINPPARPEIRINPRTGLAVIHGLGRVITEEDVRSLDDEEVEYHASFIRPKSGRA